MVPAWQTLLAAGKGSIATAVTVYLSSIFLDNRSSNRLHTCRVY